MLVGHLLHDSAKRAPNKIAIIGENRHLKYCDLDRLANQLANALNALDLKPGARVGILSSNQPEYAIVYFGLARTEFVSVHCSTRSSPGELQYVFDKTGVELLFVETTFLSTAQEAISHAKQDVQIVAMDTSIAGGVGGTTITRFDDFILDQSTIEPSQNFDDTQPLAITLTGGTTGYPKAVLVSHRARCVTSRIAAQEFGLASDDIVLASTPLFHTVGLFVWFATAVMLGATIVLQKKWSPADFSELVERERVTAAFLVPSQLNGLINDPSFDSNRLRSLSKISYAGSPMGRALFDRVQSALPLVEFTENYGQSEACPITVRLPDRTNKIGTVGRPPLGVELAVVDVAGQPLPACAVGEIVTRGAHVFSEYFNSAEETDEAFRLGNGWLLTGDLGYIDDDGYLTLVDRSKDMLISGGENVYPAEIENVLYQHDAVTECAVIGIPDAHWGEVPAAFVIKADGCDVTAQELIDFCGKTIARFKRPKLIEFVDHLPKTTVGKIRKNVLREPFWADSENKI